MAQRSVHGCLGHSDSCRRRAANRPRKRAVAVGHIGKEPQEGESVMAKKKAPRKTIKKAAPKARPRTPVKPRPQTRPLPGMEQLGASRPLDRICSSLADVRTQKNDLIEQESGLL